MPFNSDSYYRNKYRRDALAELAKARAIKARITAGEATDAERRLILPATARMARAYWRLYLSRRAVCALNSEARRDISRLKRP